MVETCYSYMEAEELIDFAMLKDNRTELELELAQRLSLALDVFDQFQAGEKEQHDARRESQSGG